MTIEIFLSIVGAVVAAICIIGKRICENNTYLTYKDNMYR